MVSGVRSGTLFPSKPTIHFYPEAERCNECGTRLQVLKSWRKTVVTMDIGAFEARETVLECPKDQKIFGSRQLRSLAPDKCTYGFDIIEYIGNELFVHCRNEREIREALNARNIFLSEREIGYLGRKFVVYLALAHGESREKQVQSMAKRGGYILHVDGTCEGDSPHLFCGMDGISEWILDNIKIPSEKKELLIPFFRRIRNHYGDPIALVHDMGIGILRAVAEVFPGIPDYICHFHFLRDVGKDLLLDDYQIIMACLRKHKVRALLRQKARYLEKKIDLDSEAVCDFKAILKKAERQPSLLAGIPPLTTYALINWIFESPSQGYGFPFDRRHLEFYDRLKTVHGLLQNISGVHLRNKAKDNRSFIQLNKLLKEVLSDKMLNDAALSMTKKAKVFDKLREALRIAVPEGKNGLNDSGDETDMKTIEEKLGKFKAWLECEPLRKATYIKMIDQMDKYWVKLFADPILVDTSEGLVSIAPQRTNNILERFFRGEKRRGRKKSGTVSLNKMLKTILADTPLVRNLEDQEYRKAILNGCASLAERFSQIDAKLVREKLKQAQKNRGKVPPGLRKLIKQLDLPQKISELFCDRSNFGANCHLRT